MIPDYSLESHQKDHEQFVNITRTRKRRAKALLDFERHDDDELGFRKNDIITVSTIPLTLSIFLPLPLSLSLSLSPPLPSPSVSLSFCMSVCLSLQPLSLYQCLFLYLSTCLSIIVFMFFQHSLMIKILALIWIMMSENIWKSKSVHKNWRSMTWYFSQLWLRNSCFWAWKKNKIETHITDVHCKAKYCKIGEIAKDFSQYSIWRVNLFFMEFWHNHTVV